MTKQETKAKERVEREICYLLRRYNREENLVVDDIVLGTVKSGKELIDYTIKLKVKGE